MSASRPQESRKDVEYRKEWEKVHAEVGRNRKRVNDRIQLEADSTIGAGGYLGQRRKGSSNNLHVVDKNRRSICPRPPVFQGKDSLTDHSQASPRFASAKHCYENAPTRPNGAEKSPTRHHGGIGVDEGRTASAGPIKSKRLPKLDQKLGEVDAGRTKQMSTDGEAEKELEMILPAESGIWSGKATATQRHMTDTDKGRMMADQLHHEVSTE
ncbi:hypothetical protein DFH09DRAFT_1277113 [Mycena vulgaris]|nr:hypothetical protein DFH09DRAFT_1277113 [Mycena vulgaris]